MTIELCEVTKTYPGTPPVYAVRDVSLLIRQGERVAVMGASGSGKSTLLHLIAGLDQPTSGTVTVAGIRLDGRRDRELSGLRAYHIGVVFQQFHLLEMVSAVENVAMGLLYRGGLAAGAGVTVVVARTHAWPAVLPGQALGLGLSAALVIGALAGLYPALRAARLSPTDALRAS